jgi:adenosine deaminase
MHRNKHTSVCLQVVEDFAADGVSYLELRTTPKSRSEHGMTKASYLEAVLLGIANYYQQLQQQLQSQRPGHEQQHQQHEQLLQDNHSHQEQQHEQQQHQGKPPILVKLLLSIDRREGPAEALETVRFSTSTLMLCN